MGRMIDARTAARVALALGLTALAGACDAGGGASAPAKRSNVILITLDTTRADYLSCYGRPEPATPHLDRLAGEGTRFDLAVATASVTPVSHASILTGLYNHEHRLRVLYADGGYRLPEDVDTLATVLAREGYRTIAVHSAFPVSSFFGFERGFDVFEDLDAEMIEGEEKDSWDVQTFQRRSDATTEIAERHLGAEPFFLWIHYWDPHDFAKLPPEEEQAPPEIRNDPDKIQAGIAQYAAEVRYMDGQIGRLFEALRAKGLYDETLIVVVADHGQGLFDHQWPTHRLLYQEQIRVPLIARIPGVRQQPVVEELVRTVDIFPTVLDFLGVELERDVSGRSLRALIEGESEEPRLAFADQINGYDENADVNKSRPLDDFLYMAMDREWKLIYRPLDPAKSELFHVSVDPKETANLFAKEPDEARRLLELLAERAPWVGGPFAKIDDGGQGAEAQAALSSLGYTGGETSDAAWAWTCPAHMDLRWDEKRPCPDCGRAPILVGR
jgi:arylsulfatase A-like enzyme